MRVLGVVIAGSLLVTGLLAQDRDPFPAHAAGWGPMVNETTFFSRWAENWSSTRARGEAPFGKAVELADDVSLTLSAESRLRANRHTNARLRNGDDFTEGLWRGVLGADLHVGEQLRFYGELASGRIDGPGASSPNLDNDVAVSQAFLDVRSRRDGLLVGAMLGRQEFADGPRQLVSLSDGPNLHRTWNGVRGYLHGDSARVSAFALWATRLGDDGFDERIDDDERLQGVTSSVVLARSERGASTFVEPFWLHSEVPDVRLFDEVHGDRRDTLGARLHGRAGRIGFDETFAYQAGGFGGRVVDAWGVFAGQDLLLTDASARPRATLRIDVASGGGSGGGAVHTFHPLYASSSYLGEGRLLSLANLVLVSPGLSFTPLADVKLSAEYGFAWRFADDDAVYGGGLRAYPGTATARGDEIGRLLRVEGRWNGPANVVVALGYERLEAADVLEHAGLPGADYAFVSVTVRY